MNQLHLAVLYGGKACEHDVSIVSGLQAADNAERAGYEVTRIYIDRQGDWQVGDALKDITFYQHYDKDKVTHVLALGEGEKLILIKYPTQKRSLLAAGRQVVATCDVAMPVMHGMNGEDGTLQGMLEMLDVPYTCAGVLGAAVGMDKIAMKMLFKGCGFPVLQATWVDRDLWAADNDQVMDHLEKNIGYPMCVKPANLGSSIGISCAKDRDGLKQSLDVAAAYDRRILVEMAVTDLKEVNCSVMGYAGDVRASVLEMPMHWDDLLLTFEDKYLRQSKGGSKSGAKGGMASLARQIPAPIDQEKTAYIQELSCQVFKALDMKGVVRIDYILRGDEVFLNEVNTIPGSLAFYLWEPEGISFGQMIDGMVENALKAHAQKHKSVFSYDSRILQAQVRGGSKGTKA